MGGKLLETVSKDRFSSEKYLMIKDKVQKALKEEFEDVSSPPALPEKESWGDIDFHVFGRDCLPSPSFLTNHPYILSKEVVITNPKTSMSFECDGIQVDLKLYNNRDEYDNDFLLMSMGGIGNMLGFGLKAIGLKWNLYGLHYIVQINNINQSYLLSSQCKEIQDFLHFDSSKLCNFKFNNQVFEELSKIPFMSYEAVYNRMNDISKKDTLKMRPSVISFLNYYLESNPSLVHFDSKEFENKIIRDRFPSVINIVLNQVSKSKRLNTVKSKFNGQIVQNILSKITNTPFQELLLGNFTSSFRASFGSIEKFQDYVISHSQEEIHDAIIDFYHNKTQK